METNRFKLRLSHMFRSSFRSCRSRDLSDVAAREPVFVSETLHQNLTSIQPQPPPSAPKVRPFTSICGPNCLNSPNPIQKSFVTHRDLFPRSRASKKGHPLSPSAVGGMDGKICPPTSPISPLNPFYKFPDFEFGDKSKKSKKKKRKKRTHLRIREKTEAFYSFSSSTSSEDVNGDAFGWFSSGDEGKEDETETLFSSKSNTLSSDSSGSRRKTYGNRLRGASAAAAASRDGGAVAQAVLPVEGKVKDSLAVVKSSSDPYGDFRASMVEMIVEKQIFGAEDLEQLLQCFLELNSAHHHRVIVEVFVEICDALFCNWS